MTKQQINTIIGALVAIGLVIAVSYGLISQQTADQIKTQTDKTFSNGQTAPDPNATPPQLAQPGTPPTPKQ